jgi:hypothetical protein
MKEVAGEPGATTAMEERPQEHAIRRRAQGEVTGSRGLKAEGSGRDKEGSARKTKARARKKERGETEIRLDAEGREGKVSAETTARRSRKEALLGWGAKCQRRAEVGGRQQPTAEPCRSWNCGGEWKD